MYLNNKEGHTLDWFKNKINLMITPKRYYTIYMNNVKKTHEVAYNNNTI